MDSRIEPVSDYARSVLAQQESEVVELVLEELYSHHPEWEAKYGQSGREHGRQDLHHHMQHLISCLSIGYLEPFREYARWLASVLKSRGMTANELTESFHAMQRAWSTRLDLKDHQIVSTVFQAGASALKDGARFRPAFYRHVMELSRDATALTDALLEGNRAVARRVVLEPVRQGAGLVEVNVGVVQPAMYEIGRRWQENEVTIAQEHLATAMAQSLMAQSFSEADFARPTGRKALFACVEGNHHTLGLRMAADAFEVTGWNMQFLGADTPTRSLLSQVKLYGPELVGLSISLPQQLDTARRAIHRLRSELGNSCPAIMVGGLATNLLDDFWKSVEADLWSPDAKAALEQI